MNILWSDIMKRCIPLMLLVCVLLPSCGFLSNLVAPIAKETGKAQLSAFSDESDLVEYFTQQVQTRSTQMPMFGRGFLADDAAGLEGVPAGAPLPGNAADGDTLATTATGEFSQTTTQEAGVDEADVVKTDGTHLYVIRNRGAESKLTIVQLSPADSLGVLSQVSLTGFGREMYLYGDKVVALTEISGGFFFFFDDFDRRGGMNGDIIFDEFMMAPPAGEVGVGVAVGVEGETSNGSPGMMSDSDIEEEPVPPSDLGIAVIDPSLLFEEAQFERPQTIVTVIDVVDPQNPVVLSETKFDGIASSSRLIDGVLHLVVSNFQHHFFDRFPHLGEPDFDPGVVSVDDILPNFTRTDADGVVSTGMVLSPEQLFHPTDPDGFGIVTLVSVDIDDDANFSAVGVMAEPGLIYSSTSAMYMTDTQYDFTGTIRETTDIYKFAYVDRAAAPVAFGSVPGRVLNQYSMGEHKGFLRVATTVSAPFSPFAARPVPHNNVYILGQVEEELTMMGSITDIAPRETIQSARFVGDRGYVVTFEQIDPLFTLDLSDPSNPTIMGELKVPGFSTFLQPIDENHLLAVGQYIPEDGFFSRGVQLSIFDVTDFSNPVLSSSVILGEESGAYSEALNNPKALTYFAEGGMVALPVHINEAFDFPFPLFGDDAVFFDRGMPGMMGDVEPDFTDGTPPFSDSDDAFVSSPAVEFVPQGFEGLVVFSVDVVAGLSELGRFETRFPDAGIFWSSFTRGVFVDQHIFAITDHGIRGSTITDINNPAYELLFDD